MESMACYESKKLRKGLWSPQEDEKLYNHIMKYGVSSWSSVPKQAGLQRCGKSCRLRWMNYLKPDLKRGKFSEAEEDMIINMHKALGNKWSQIAAKLPGRTDNEVKNFWNSCLKKKLMQRKNEPEIIVVSEKKLKPKEARSGDSSAIGNVPIKPIFNLFPSFLLETDMAAATRTNANLNQECQQNHYSLKHSESATSTNMISSYVGLSGSCDFGEVLDVSNSYGLHGSCSEDSSAWSSNLLVNTSWLGNEVPNWSTENKFNPAVETQVTSYELSSLQLQGGLHHNPDAYSSSLATPLLQDFSFAYSDAFQADFAYEFDPTLYRRRC